MQFDLTGQQFNCSQAALPQGIVPFVFAKEYNCHPDILSTAYVKIQIFDFVQNLLWFRCMIELLKFLFDLQGYFWDAYCPTDNNPLLRSAWSLDGLKKLINEERSLLPQP